MKKLYFLFIVFLSAVMLISCSKDDEESFSEADILGAWNGDKLTMEFSGNGIDETTKTLLEAFFPPEVSIEGTVLNFKDDNTLEVTGTSNVELASSGTWSMAGKELTITSDGESYTYLVKQLTSNALELYIRETDDSAGMELTIESSMFFSK